MALSATVSADAADAADVADEIILVQIRCKNRCLGILVRSGAMFFFFDFFRDVSCETVGFIILFGRKPSKNGLKTGGFA